MKRPDFRARVRWPKRLVEGDQNGTSCRLRGPGEKNGGGRERSQRKRGVVEKFPLPSVLGGSGTSSNHFDRKPEQKRDLRPPVNLPQ